MRNIFECKVIGVTKRRIKTMFRTNSKRDCLYIGAFRRCLESEAYPNRSVPWIFTKYIHSIDRIVPIVKIAVIVCQFSSMLCYLRNVFFLLWKQVRSIMTVWWSCIPRGVHPLLINIYFSKTSELTLKSQED